MQVLIHLVFFSYPTRIKLTEIAQPIVKIHPFLEDKSIGSGFVSWISVTVSFTTV